MKKKENIGLVVKVFGLFYTVRFENKEYNCVLRGRIRKNKELKKYSNPIAVGDEVLFSISSDETPFIIKIVNRNNVFSRKEKGKSKKEDIIAANLDNIVVIQSFSNPSMNLRFVDRLAVRAYKEGINVILCLNKKDEADDESINYVLDYYHNTNLEIFFTSAKTNDGVEQFHHSILGKRSILSGYSGVGKSSILNCIYPDLNLATSEISENTGKGRHTTTNVSLISLDDNTQIIDTPGVREFGIPDIDPPELGDYFYEFFNYSDKCHFQPCTHDHEPRCFVKEKVGSGEIHPDRYQSYLNILNSLREYQDSMY